MADIGIDGSVLRVRLTVAERLLGLHPRDIEIPLAAVDSVRAVEQIYAQLRGLRLPGTGIPGLLAIGTWRGRRAGRRFRDFAIIHRRGPGVVITAPAGGYDRILVSTDDPQAMVDALST